MKSKPNKESFVHNSISTLSTSQASFFTNYNKFIDQLLLTKCFKENSYEILQFLSREDIHNLKRANKFFLDICECHLLFSESIESLGDLFKMTIDEQPQAIKKQSKVREKFNFNKPMEKYYKNTKQYSERIQSAKKGRRNFNAK